VALLASRNHDPIQRGARLRFVDLAIVFRRFLGGLVIALRTSGWPGGYL